MRYKVKFPSKSLSKKFTRVLNKIPSEKIRDKIMEDVLNLAYNPRPHGKPKLKPPVEVYSYVAQHRLRIGDYRVLYDVDDKKRTAWILALTKRSEKTYK